MKTTLTVNTRPFEIESKLHKTGVPFPNMDDTTLHNSFKIKVTHLDTTENGKLKKAISKLFNFYDSHNNYLKGNQDLSEEDLKLAFRAFIDDANLGTVSFNEFCNELGYDTDSIKASKIHKACIQSLNKIKAIGISESELPDILNELSEMGIS